jgi:hypothetical protein
MDPDIPLLDHELASDEIDWMAAVHKAFETTYARGGVTKKEALRAVLARPEFQLPGPLDLTGAGPWRGGRNRHGRNLAAVFLPKAELHRHSKSRTDQFAMYVMGEAECFSFDAAGAPTLRPVRGGDHFHNPPNAPHAFVPKTGQAVPDDWEIAFIAITPRNLREDTQEVSAEVKTAYARSVGREAPAGV